MTLEQHTEIIRKLKEAAGENSHLIVEDLATLSSDYMSTLDTLETANNSVAKLTSDKELLQQANNKLFLQVGVSAKPEQEEQQEEQQEKREFSNLFKGD